jgi:hypothetical protein
MHDGINRLLTDFGNAMGLDGLSLDDSGYCCLSFDDVLVNMESVDGSSRVLLYSSLGALPEDAGPAVCRQLLEANYFFLGTAGATIGLDGTTGAVAMTRVVDVAGMAVLDWEAVIKAFVDAAESCSGLFDAAPAADAPVAPPSRFEQFIRG